MALPFPFFPLLCAVAAALQTKHRTEVLRLRRAVESRPVPPLTAAKAVQTADSVEHHLMNLERNVSASVFVLCVEVCGGVWRCVSVPLASTSLNPPPPPPSLLQIAAVIDASADGGVASDASQSTQGHGPFHRLSQLMDAQATQRQGVWPREHTVTDRQSQTGSHRQTHMHMHARIQIHPCKQTHHNEQYRPTCCIAAQFIRLISVPLRFHIIIININNNNNNNSTSLSLQHRCQQKENVLNTIQL